MGGGHHHSGHGHGDTHRGHAHDHAPADFGRAFLFGIGFNLLFVVIEAIYGVIAGSMALLADAGHNLSDVLGLVMAWSAYALSRRPATGRFTYGLRSSSILAALMNAILLFVACGAIAWEALQRFGAPPDVRGGTVMAVAAIGIVVNLGTALLFARGRKGDINIRGAFLHMAADAAVSACVVLSGFLVLRTGIGWIDPAVSLVIVGVILVGTIGLFRDSLAMSLHAVPPGIDSGAVNARLRSLAGVADVHHLHIWPTSTTETALTAHLLMPAGHPGDAFLRDAARLMAADHGIAHATFQIEVGHTGDCGGAQAACGGETAH